MRNRRAPPASPRGCAGVLPRIRAADVTAIGPRDAGELAAAGVATLDGQLRALIRPAELTAGGYGAALASGGCAGWSVCIYNPTWTLAEAAPTASSASSPG